ncbi:hypothetical protein C900_03882 [Fulvivirga imtechensis AK7]|uniref:Uncharacterized protein n=1 Tax=Fulvivirga imtechensis AK7 TaxID=1237149 RepID=L8JS50_9BACT|nr:hypothetical protein C900_03882 [Fulvivirga imtechensis AK7]
MNIQQLNEQPIVDFLEMEGIYPRIKRGVSWWYISSIRPLEKTPSFKVDTRINSPIMVPKPWNICKRLGVRLLQRIKKLPPPLQGKPELITSGFFSTISVCGITESSVQEILILF